jgi:hypothetical protein
MTSIISEAFVSCNTRAASVNRGRIRSVVKSMSLAHPAVQSHSAPRSSSACDRHSDQGSAASVLAHIEPLDTRFSGLKDAFLLRVAGDLSALVRHWSALEEGTLLS